MAAPSGQLSSPPPPGTMTFLKATLRPAAPGATQSPRTAAGAAAAAAAASTAAASSPAIASPALPAAGLPVAAPLVTAPLIPIPGMPLPLPLPVPVPAAASLWSPALVGRTGAAAAVPPATPGTPAARRNSNSAVAARPASTPLPPSMATPLRAGTAGAAAGAAAGATPVALSLQTHTPPRGDLSSPTHTVAVHPLAFHSSPPHAAGVGGGGARAGAGGSSPLSGGVSMLSGGGGGGGGAAAASASASSSSASASASGVSTPTSSSSSSSSSAAGAGATPPAVSLSSGGGSGGGVGVGHKRKSRSNAAAKAKAKLLAAAAHSTIKEETGFCDVCYASDSDPNNPVVYCSACHVGVHRTCYGNPLLNTALPTANWKCERCAWKAQDQRCVLCPVTTGAMKRTTDWRWCHLRCALWMPEAFFRQPEAREPIDCTQIKAHRFEEACMHCGTNAGPNGGACLQCAVPGCARTFHVTCGMAHGVALHCQAVPLIGAAKPGVAAAGASASASAAATVDVIVARCAKHAQFAADVAAASDSATAAVMAASASAKPHPPLASTSPQQQPEVAAK